MQELGELLVPDMYLQLKLTEGKGLPRFKIWLDERSKCLKLPTFDVDLEDINVGMFYEIVSESVQDIYSHDLLFIFMRVSRVYIGGSSSCLSTPPRP